MARCDSESPGRHLVLERNKTLLNGRVTSCKDIDSSEDESIDTDITYEYMYTMHDKHGEDGFQYRFDAYPVLKHDNETLLKPSKYKGGTLLTKCETKRRPKTEQSESPRSVIDSYICDCVVNDYQDTLRKPPCSKGHVSFCDISDITNSAYSLSKRVNGVIANNNGGPNRPCITKAKPECGEMVRIKPPVCSIQESPLVTRQSDQQIRRKDSEFLEGKPPSSATKIPWKERLKLAIKREVSRSSTSPKTPETNKRRQSVSYDPDLEKSTAYIHGGGSQNFSRAKTSLTPVRTGLKHLQMNYTETNLEANQSIIFLDLLKTCHQQARLRGASISNIERRLASKRDNEFYATSFYENKDIPDPHRRQEKKTARSMVQKQYERQKKIRRTTDELQIGYKRTFLTIKIPTRDEVENIGTNCRYLRYTVPGSIDN